jgi:hypothetical protein
LYSKAVIFVVISVLVVALGYSPSYTFSVFGQGRNMGEYACEFVAGGKLECCALDLDTYDTWCTTCDNTIPPSNCSEAELQFKEQPPTPPTPPLTPRGTPPLGEIAPEAEQPPAPPQPTPRTPGQSVLPGEGVLQQPPADDGTAPRTVEPPTADEATQPPPEPLTDCPEGQILDEETGLCVLEETEAVEEPEPAEEAEEQSTEEETDNSDNSNN